MENLPTTNAGWLELGNNYLLRHPMRTAPLVPERGEGIYMWDVEGKRYIDFQSGQLCVTLGHSHPDYVKALCAQAEKIVQVGTTFIAPSEVLLAKKIAEIAPDPLQKSFFACTGSESNEMALRLVRKYTGRFEVIALMRGYHGQSYGSASITGRGGMLREGYGPMPTGASFVPPPYTYRCQYCKGESCCNLGCADAAEYVIDTSTSGKPAAFFFEPMMSAAGQIVPSKEWIHRMVEICKARDILMVADEALTCFGRTGKWFAFEHFDFVPDIVTCSKGLGGGVPLCAVITSAEIADGAVAKGYMPFSSHAGDPLLCATGLANIEIVERDNLVENARVVGAYFMEKLVNMQNQYEIVGEARGLGLCLGLELVTDKKSREPNFEGVAAVTNYCYENGLWLPIVPLAKFNDPLQRRFMEMSGSHVLRFMPPITVTKAQIDEAMEILDAGLRIAEEQTAVGASAAE
ncbi:MAG: aspartate aminotransferase family protein [Candidatus Latescibacteria bacterium]|jgi:4-aminobutyrate aminotransferase-like enzyme|nr:aspartate aminotransferase family protein [Candidatus Latescibacterota bacterium]